MNIIVKTLIVWNCLGINCVQVPYVVATTCWLKNYKRKHQIWPDIHKTNGAIVSVSLILRTFICQT